MPAPKLRPKPPSLLPRAVRVRPAGPSDLSAIVRFNRAMARETEGLELAPRRLARGVRAALADPARGRYRVAEIEGEVAGCLMVTREWSDWRDGWIWWIQSVYVEPAARRRGVYRALHEAVLGEARRAGDVRAVRLYVDRGNRAAQAVYARMGMRRSRYALLEDDFARRPWRRSP